MLDDIEVCPTEEIEVVVEVTFLYVEFLTYLLYCPLTVFGQQEQQL